MPILKQGLVPLVRKHSARFERLRVGVLFYRDYFEQYLVQPHPFVESLDDVQSQIDRARVHGGKEIPEAVHEALLAGIEGYPWEAESRILVLIGDAPPHPLARGKVTEEMVYARAREAGVRIHTIILPP